MPETTKENLHVAQPFSPPETYKVNSGVSNESLLRQSELFTNTLDYLVSTGLELPEEKYEHVKEAGEELIQEFGLSEEFFNNDVRSILFTSLANEYADLKTTNAEFGSVAAYKEFVTNTLVLLAGEHSNYKELTQELKGPMSEDGMLAVYDRYTNAQLSTELKEAIINGGLVDDVKEKLGITSETERPFEVRVLNVAGENDTFGMRLPTPTALNEGLFLDDPRYLAARKDFDYNVAAIDQYTKGLVEKGAAFSSELGREALFAPAWVTHLNGKTVLCMPLPYAEKLLYKDQERSDYYDERAQARDLSFLKHEYVHTQQMLLGDEDPHLGIALEELRAEHMSGDKNGYVDIKKHFAQTGKVLGFNPKSLFDTYGPENPYSPKDFYAQVAKNVGLDGLLDFVTAFPSNYVSDSDSNKLLKEINAYVGGLSGLQEKAWHRAVVNGHEQDAEQRLKDYLLTISKTMNPEDYLQFGGGGDTFLAKKLLTLWQDIKPKDYQPAF